MFVAPPHLQLLAGLVQPRILLPKHSDYLLEQRARHTFVHRVAPLKLNDAPCAYLWRWLKAHPRWLPLVFKLLRLIAETSPKPLAFFVASRLIRVLLPLTLSWAEAHHLSLVSRKISTRGNFRLKPFKVHAACISNGKHPSGLARFTLLRLLLPMAQQYVSDLSSENEGVLSSQVFHMIRQQFVKMRMSLDIETLTDPDFIELESRATNFMPYTMISDAVDLMVSFVEIVGVLRLLQILRRSGKLSSRSILGFALASSSFEYLNFLFKRGPRWTAIRHFPAR